LKGHQDLYHPASHFDLHPGYIKNSKNEEKIIYSASSDLYKRNSTQIVIFELCIWFNQITISFQVIQWTDSTNIKLK
jgi:hypothetical protein